MIYKRVSLLFFFVLMFFLENINSQNLDTVTLSNIFNLSLEELTGVKVVAAGKKEQEIQNIPASVVVITRQDIERFGYSSLTEVLNQVPGLYLWDGYHVRGRINIGIRGFTSSDNVIILVNGVNQVEGVYNEYLLTKVGVPVEAIDKIEVIRGPMSVLYGSGAFFGVINIITNEIDEERQNIVSLQYGSNNTKKIVGKVGVVSDDIKIGVSAAAYGTDGIDVPYSKMMSNPNNLINWGLSPQATTKGMLKDKRVYFNVNGKYKGLSIDMSHSEVERGGFLVQPTVDYSPSKRHSTNFKASYEYSFNEKVSLVGKLSYLTTSSMSHYFLFEPDSYVTFGYNSDAYELEALTFLKPHKKLDITLGISHRNVYHATNPAELAAVWGASYGNTLTRLGINSRMIDNAVFSQISYMPFKNISIVGGIRLQQMLPYEYEASGGATLVSDGRQHYTNIYDIKSVYGIPSLAVLYSIGKNHTAKFLYGEALRYPPLGKLADILYSASNVEAFEFPLLSPSKIKTYEINYSGLFYSKFSVQASLFFNDLNNLISQYFLDISDTTTVYYTSNKGKMRTFGGELSLRYEPTNKLSVIVSAMFQDSENKTEGLIKVPVPYSPEYTGYFSLSYSVFPKLSLYANGQLIGSMFPEYNYQTNTWLGEETNPHSMYNAGILLNDVGLNGLQINLKCLNIFNTDVHYPVTTLNQFADKGLLDFPRRFFIIMSYNF